MKICFLLLCAIVNIPMMALIYLLANQPKEEIRFAILDLNDVKNEQVVIPKATPSGVPIVSQWNAYEDATGRVWYGQKH